MFLADLDEVISSWKSDSKIGEIFLKYVSLSSVVLIPVIMLLIMTYRSFLHGFCFCRVHISSSMSPMLLTSRSRQQLSRAFKRRINDLLELKRLWLLNLAARISQVFLLNPLQESRNWLKFWKYVFSLLAFFVLSNLLFFPKTTNVVVVVCCVGLLWLRCCCLLVIVCLLLLLLLCCCLLLLLLFVIVVVVVVLLLFVCYCCSLLLL